MRELLLGLSGVLWSGEKPGLPCTIVSETSLAMTPAHTGPPNIDQAKFNGDRTGSQGYRPLCAIF